VDSESAQSGIVLFVMRRLERKENLAKFDNDRFGSRSSEDRNRIWSVANSAF
jgi:hypothetical protein